MKQYFSFSKIVFILAAIALSIGVAAFSQASKNRKKSLRAERLNDNNDTPHIRVNPDKLDAEMRQIDIEMKRLDVEMKNLDVTVDKEVKEAMKAVDVEKIDVQIDEAMKNLDTEKLNREVNESLERVRETDFKNMKKEIEMAKADLQKQKKLIKSQVGEIDVQKIKEAAQDAMSDAKISMQKARAELKNTQEFIDTLAKDGMIDKSKACKIEVKNGELYIDGKKQPKEVSDKYRHYFKSENFKIDMSAGDEFRI